jgi:signal transduction histidine kinase
VRETLQRDMRQTLDRLHALAAAAVALDDDEATQAERLRRQDSLAVLSASLADLEGAVRTVEPLDAGADAQQAWQALSAVFDRAQGRDLRQLIADSVAREEMAVLRERTAADISLARMRNFWLAMAATLALLAAAAAVYFARALRKPLDQLSEGARALHQGQLRHRIPLEGADEFSAVARSMNDMAAELERHRAREAEQRQHLEDQVNARTAELREALDALRQADARRRQLFADVSHELRTPTTAILGEAEITLRGTDRPADEYKATLRRIVSTSRQLAAVIDDLLAMARSDIDALSLVKRPVDLAEIVQQAQVQAAALGTARSVHVRAEPADQGPCWVLGDAQRLRQLLLTLLDNAVRYSPPHSEVGIRLRVADGGAAGVGRSCLVEVADNGIGISAHELPQVFERHFRGEAARRQRPDGSGLGLAIAQALSRAHGGHLELRSTVGKGTVARLTLPALDLPHSAAPMEPQAA